MGKAVPVKETRVIDGIETIGRTELLDKLSAIVARQRAAVDLARPALARIVGAMTHKTGQGYKLRCLLYSLWNGKPAPLIECVGLDHELREDFCAVILAWGYGRGEWEFFYDAMQKAIRDAGLWPWFLEEQTVVHP